MENKKSEKEFLGKKRIPHINEYLNRPLPNTQKDNNNNEKKNTSKPDKVNNEDKNDKYKSKSFSTVENENKSNEKSK